MRMSHPSEPARYGQENLGRFLHERRLMLKRKRQVPVALGLGGEGSKSPTSHTKGGQPSVGDLFHALQAQRNPPKIGWGHRATPVPY